MTVKGPFQPKPLCDSMKVPLPPFLIKCLLFTITGRQNAQTRPRGSEGTARRHSRGAARPPTKPPTSPWHEPAVPPSPASWQAPAQELLQLANPENRPHRCAGFLTGQEHQPSQRGSQEKGEEATGKHHPAGDKEGGSQMAEANSVLSLHFASCRQLYSYYKSTECVLTEPLLV